MKELMLKDLEKLDIVELTSDEYEKIDQWCNNNKKLLLDKYDKIHSVFNNFLIKITYDDKLNSICHFRLNEENEIFYCSVYLLDENILKKEPIYFFDVDENTFQELKYIFMFGHKNGIKSNINYGEFYESKCLNNNNLLKNNLRKDFKLLREELFFILFYSQLNQESIIRQTRTHKHKYQSKKNKRAGKKPKVKLIKQNIIRLNTDHIPEPTEEEKRLYERHTFGWTVRGHWRHYQSGKDVWIKPQVRGDKDKVEGKIYEI
ncbi:hypothetical protein D9O40_16740 [Clostridium autoethanogenum]|uniref:Uncharacterized protein n=1 Tax=Clostridium autoethanogenum TaxID=84023 RepID=A0A3M0S9E1_9CLOT|nr:hypothetical protein [Clostridium autoethanogenum]RMC95186.1 hypothetical protein D9O40_16740 [Clostridium autoethanogenum]